LAPHGGTSARFSADRITKILSRGKTELDEEGLTEVAQSHPSLPMQSATVKIGPHPEGTPGLTLGGAALQKPEAAARKRAFVFIGIVLGFGVAAGLVVLALISR